MTAKDIKALKWYTTQHLVRNVFCITFSPHHHNTMQVVFICVHIPTFLAYCKFIRDKFHYFLVSALLQNTNSEPRATTSRNQKGGNILSSLPDTIEVGFKSLSQTLTYVHDCGEVTLAGLLPTQTVHYIHRSMYILTLHLQCTCTYTPICCHITETLLVFICHNVFQHQPLHALTECLQYRVT